MTKKAFTILFVLVATIVNIVMTLAVIILLAVVSTLLIRVVLRIERPDVLLLTWMVCFIGGLILDMVLYSKLCDKVIEKFKLAEKLDPRLLRRRSGFPASSRQTKSQPEKPKTVLPKSVLPDEEEDHWGEERENGESSE